MRATTTTTTTWIVIAAVFVTTAVAFTENELIGLMIALPHDRIRSVRIHELLGPNNTALRAQYYRLPGASWYPKTKYSRIDEQDQIVPLLMLDQQTGLSAFPENREHMRLGSFAWNSFTKSYDRNYNIGSADLDHVFFEIQEPEPEPCQPLPQFPDRNRWLRKGSCGWNPNTQTYDSYRLVENFRDFDHTLFEIGDYLPTRQEFDEMQRTDLFPPDSRRDVEDREQICLDDSQQ